MEQIFKQYLKIKMEIKDIEERIKKNQKSRESNREEKKAEFLDLYKKKQEREEELLIRILSLEESIQKIESSDIRLIARFYFVDGLTWVQVAHRLNVLCNKNLYTDESCRKKIERFFSNKK